MAHDSSSATFFLMSDHSVDRTWTGPVGSAWVSTPPSGSGVPEGTRPVYGVSRRGGRRPALAGRRSSPA